MNEIFEPNQRIIMLQMMAGDNDYSLNNHILQRVLVEFGHGISLAKTDEEIDWLADRELVTVDDLANGMRVAKLTRLGLDVANGHERIDGVDRPGPA